MKVYARSSDARRVTILIKPKPSVWKIRMMPVPQSIRMMLKIAIRKTTPLSGLARKTAYVQSPNVGKTIILMNIKQPVFRIRVRNVHHRHPVKQPNVQTVLCEDNVQRRASVIAAMVDTCSIMALVKGIVTRIAANTAMCAQQIHIARMRLVMLTNVLRSPIHSCAQTINPFARYQQNRRIIPA